MDTAAESVPASAVVFRGSQALCREFSLVLEAKGIEHEVRENADSWVLAAAPDAVPIPGTKRRSYLEDNLGALSLSLTAEDMTGLNRLASMAVGDRYPPSMAKTAER